MKQEERGVVQKPSQQDPASDQPGPRLHAAFQGIQPRGDDRRVEESERGSDDHHADQAHDDRDARARVLLGEHGLELDPEGRRRPSGFPKMSQRAWT